jgi:hypothetical protein
MRALGGTRRLHAVEQAFQGILEELHTVRESSDAARQILQALHHAIERFQEKNV